MDWLILGIAVYAAVVATATGAWAVYGVWRDRTSVKVEVFIGYVEQSTSVPYLISSPRLDPKRINEATRLIVRGMNNGRRPVVLRQGGISIDGNPRMFMGEGLGSGSLPRTLPEGASFDTWTDLSRLTGLRPCRPALISANCQAGLGLPSGKEAAHASSMVIAHGTLGACRELPWASK